MRKGEEGMEENGSGREGGGRVMVENEGRGRKVEGNFSEGQQILLFQTDWLSSGQQPSFRNVGIFVTRNRLQFVSTPINLAQDISPVKRKGR